MDANLKKKFEFIRSDINCDDWTGMATLSDVESIACECITTGHKHEGCILLESFTRLHVNRKLPIYIREFLAHLDLAEKALT